MPFRSPRRACRSFAALLVALSPLSAQETPATPQDRTEHLVPDQAPVPPPPPRFVQLRYPSDKEYVIAMVAGSPIWLQHLVQHVDERHYPGFEALMTGEEGKGTAEGQRILESDLLAPWVRQLADVRALEAEAKARGPIDQEKLEAAQAAALKASFEEFLKAYTMSLEKQGLPSELTQKRVNRLLVDFQFRHGLSCELQGWLDYLQPEQDWSTAQLNQFYQDHPRYFGGSVTVRHVLVQNRDPGTGILLQEPFRIAAAARLSEVQKRLQPDGSNFAEVAKQYSDDSTSAQDGGKLERIERFDLRMPTAICRAAWSMKDGEVSDVIESQYGWHVVQRLEHVQNIFLYFSDETIPMVKSVLKRELQENLLFAVRKKHGVELRL